MKTLIIKRSSAAPSLGALALLLAAPLWSQTIPPAPATAPADDKDKVLNLSPFEVRSEDDVGYQAMNTTSGSRLGTSLKDTAASISPFTPEFLSDIAATSVTDMLAYSANAELNAGDAEGAGFNNPRDFSSAGGEPFRIRGIPGGVSTDYVENAAPQDLYNIERAEVASGPNSILFGSGDAGGLVSLSSKRANVSRTKFSGQAQFASWAGQRYTTDLNWALIPKTFAVRLNALYSDAKAWRRYEFNDAKRIAPAITYKPFKKTTIAANYENGLVVNSVGLKWNTTDQISRWVAAGRPISDATAADTTKGFSSQGANQRFTYFTQDGLVSNQRNELRSNIAPGTADTLLAPSIFPYDVNWAGPQTKLSRDFSSYQVSIEQRVSDTLTVQGIYLNNNTKAKARSFVYNGNVMDFLGDPNLTIPAQNGTGTITNPRAGQLYLESNQFGDATDTKNEIKRLSIAYELKLGKWFGNHRFAALGENAEQHKHTWSTREILVDQLNRPAANATPENAQNLVYRRTYVKEGDFSTYALTGLYTPLTPFSYNGLTLSSRQINTGELTSVKDIDSYMLAAQSSWLDGRVTTTLGYRRDDIVYLDTTSGRVTDPADPRVTSGKMLLNEVVALPGFNRNTYTADTLTAGGVWHIHKRFSVFYNQSTNHGAPRFDRRILPTGAIPQPPSGKGHDMGVMIDLLGDDRFFARITYFDTKQVGDAAVSPSGAVTDAAALGRSQTKVIVAALVAAGKMTQAQADAETFNWNAAVIDTASKGVELELIANPTKNWTIRANYSHSERDRENFFAEGYAFFAAKFTEWRTLAAGNAALLATVETNITAIQTNELDGRAVAQEQGFGSIPHKATLTTRYKFDGNGPLGDKLKGAFVGAAVRYQSKAFSQTDTRAASAGGTGKDYYADGSLQTDAFAGYRFRLPWHKLPASIQINGRNIFNSDLVSLARYNADFTGARRIYLREPRSLRLTLGLEY